VHGASATAAPLELLVVQHLPELLPAIHARDETSRCRAQKERHVPWMSSWPWYAGSCAAARSAVETRKRSVEVGNMLCIDDY
jgi:hypothetical protein